MTEHSDLLEIVRRPLSPDVQLEVQASWEEYERVQAILENEECKNVAIVAAPPSALHGNMAGELMASIMREVWTQQGLSSEVSRGFTQSTEMGNTRGLTTRGWDRALVYQEGNRDTFMIAVEVGVSQSYESVRAAISWSVCALRCRLGIAMCIREQGRGEAPDPPQYSSIQEENAAVDEAAEDFRHQLTERPYGPLVRDGVTWFGRLERVVLETYRAPDENITESMVLDPSGSFTIVEDGEFVGGDVPPNLQEVVLGDCIPDHILDGDEIVARPVKFFRRDWFEARFQAGMTFLCLACVLSLHVFACINILFRFNIQMVASQTLTPLGCNICSSGAKKEREREKPAHPSSYKNEFRHQLTERLYGPLVRDSVTCPGGSSEWFWFQAKRI
ncbi:hypothetical protein V1517DRAFT_310932 [Lipomyces orientalis]|uniref:Uncharacterized protein n=1 Tax=Lipomyces orientalis TaxID=1233043 RepID=A0ACC3TE08_9ASCO